MQNNIQPEQIETLPAVREVVTEIGSLETLARDYKIATPEQYSTGGEDLKRVKAAQKRVEETRTSMTGPLNESLKRINNFFRAPADRLSRIERSIKDALTDYTIVQRRKQQEEQLRADEAARKEREKIEAQARKAAESGKVEKAEQLEQRAAAVVAPVIHREPPKVKGISTRTVWKYRVKDKSLLPREYLVEDHPKLGRVVNALKADTNIPGIEVYSEEIIASGAA